MLMPIRPARLQNKANLMNEVIKSLRVMKKLDENCASEVHVGFGRLALVKMPSVS